MRDYRSLRNEGQYRFIPFVFLAPARAASSSPERPPARLRTAALVLLLVAGFVARPVQAQAPSILWMTNFNATVFAVDAQTNVYANSGGAVLVLGSGRGPLFSETHLPLAG